MLTILLDREARAPLYEQLYKSIRSKIAGGELKADEKLPSKRKLAVHLNISQITVQNTYAQLIAEGYIRSVPKRGYYVEKIEIGNLTKVDKHKLLQVPPESKVPPYRFDLKTNAVDTSFFPFTTWAKIARLVLNKKSEDLLNASPTQGLWDLRKEIATYLYNFRGIEAKPEQIVLGAGYEYLMVIMIRLLGWQSIHAIEDPGYHKISRILQAGNVGIVPIALDDHGLDLDSLRQSGANVVHISPSHQFPTGIVMPVSRRVDLLNWANEAPNRYIIESDYDSEFRFSGNPLPACQCLDSQGKVIYTNTFTKSLAPSLRIGYMVLPPNLLETYWDNFKYYSCTVPNFEQYILYEFIHSGCLERHLNRMCKVYRKKRDTFIAAMRDSSIGRYIEFIGCDAGLHLLMQVNLGLSGEELIQSSAASGVKIYGIHQYYYQPRPAVSDNLLVIGYSGMALSDIAAAAGCLIQAWEGRLNDKRKKSR